MGKLGKRQQLLASPERREMAESPYKAMLDTKPPDEYSESFDFFVRSLIHLNEVTKTFPQKEIDVLWDLLERWEMNKRR